MGFRRAAALVPVLGLATACTAILGVEDVPNAPNSTTADGGSSGNVSEASTTEGGGGGDREASIARYAEAYCRKFSDCAGSGFGAFYADVNECKTLRIASVREFVDLPGTTASAADFDGCSSRYAALTCDVFRSADSDFTCLLKGSKKQNDRCIFGAQCESGFCATSRNACRGCIAAPVDGADCAANSACGPGLVCNGDNKCVTPAKVGMSCSASKPCAGAAACVAGTCEPLVDSPNAPCTKNPGCDALKGLFCYVPTGDTSGTCVQVAYSTPGKFCSTVANTGTQFTLCLRLASCTEASNTCPTLPTKAGDPCGTDFGECPDPLYCNAGTCTANPPSSFCE